MQASSARKSGSRIVLALDLPYRKKTDGLLQDSLGVLERVSDFICAVKINFHLIIPLSIAELSMLNNRIHSKDLVSIADIKLNDISNTNEVAINYLWDSGFDAVIANPFVGLKGGLDVVYETANQLDKGVITLAYMSHPGADEGYGLELKNSETLFELMLKRANEWGSDAVIVGTTRSEKIVQARSVLKKSVKIISPGSGAQGGDPIASFKAGADYLIYGRAVVNSEDPAREARRIYEALKLPV
ncbi:MAG TPA: orotidine 5'-phosphate decarboxylase / HUMPS family protein [Nitrososphaerales archaeon]|nr:orotidine 5'-phosphate decarboxylase / HUMPS family protein [Nitrososphaerales archaeon]